MYLRYWFPEEYAKSTVTISKGDNLDRRSFLSKMVQIHYSRNDKVLERGNIRVEGML